MTRWLLLGIVLLARGVGASPDLWLPSTEIPAGHLAEAFEGVSDRLTCMSFTSVRTLASITEFAFGTGGSSGWNGTCGVAIYDATGSTQLASGSAACTEITNLITITGITPFTITADTTYLYCWCLGNLSGLNPEYSGVLFGRGGQFNAVDAFNVFGTLSGIAANSCTAGVPPATPGALTLVMGGASKAPLGVLLSNVTTTTSTSSTSSTSSSTSSSTAVSTSTSSSTSSSTSTTTLPGDNASLLVLPDVGATANSAGMANNTLYCARVVPRLSIAVPTKLYASISGSSSTTCGIAVYADADAGAKIIGGSAACPTAAGVISITGLTATGGVLSGTRYRVCICDSGGSQTYIGVTDPGPDFRPAYRVFTTDAVGTAANSCSVGVPPSTTGAITGSNSFLLPTVVIR